MQASNIIDVLRKKYAMPEWVFLTEVRSSPGFKERNHRYLDAFAMSLYPSRGLTTHGFEVKISRGDWKKELADQSKAEDFFHYCDRFFLVIPNDRKIILPGELPDTWGLITVASDGKMTTTQPKVLSDPAKSKFKDRDFVACLLRREHDQDEHLAKLKAAERKAFSAGYTDGIAFEKNNHKFSATTAETKLRNLETVVASFEKASGIRLNEWTSDAANLGEMFRKFLSLEADQKNFKRQVALIRDQAQRMLVACDVLHPTDPASGSHSKTG